MNNEPSRKAEPVAWMSPDGRFSTTEGKLFYIPLYTHPAKTLTDEEIATLKEIIRISDRKHDLWDKAKEILK